MIPTTTLLLDLSPLLHALPSSSTPYTLLASYAAPTFFDHFTFFTGPDPTNGHVNYTSRSVAANNSYVGYIHHAATNTTTAYLGVDHDHPAPAGRSSVRLVGKDAWNVNSLIVFDIRHIPVQWGLWPAIWLLGRDGVWPETGESDVLEYVHRGARNAMTLHTAPGCVVSNATTVSLPGGQGSQQQQQQQQKSPSFQGNLLKADCNADAAKTGCSITAPSPRNNSTLATAGSAFNAQGGGVYVHAWTSAGISVYLFPHGGLPADLTAGRPDPSTWTMTPLARFAGPGCDFEKSFRDLNVVINIDFCGAWAGEPGVWEASGAREGTGVETCEEWVADHPGEFEESYFELGGIQVYGLGK